MDYRDTLNLPRTGFPMKANLPAREPEIQQSWEKMGLYRLIQEKNAGRPDYILHDGPPYTSGEVHLGTAMNKVLKDIIVKFRSMQGYRAPYVPGYDMHGLPTEMRAIREFDIDRHAIDTLALRTRCMETAHRYMKVQTDQFKRMGVLGEWDHPYLTADPAYEAAEMGVFRSLVEQGAVYRGLKPVHWCATCETALAQAEIEYRDAESPSIWVKFALGSWRRPGPAERGWPSDNVYFIVWTTTPWTLPANVAVALNPSHEYSLVGVGDEWWIMARDLVGATMQALGIDDYDFDEARSLPGSVVAGHGRPEEIREGGWAVLKHPFLEDREVRLVLADYVTLEQGTGCVHTAPGHGEEDFETGRQYGLPVLQPLDDRGYFGEEGGRFAGMRYDQADAAILQTMRDRGTLLRQDVVAHSYPHCWRCGNPVLFRATQQWFVALGQYLEDALRSIEKVQWVPAWGKVRITSMVKERPDWCISRQRAWGVPIPAFYCEKCGEVLLTPETVGRVQEIFREQGSDAWFRLEARELLPVGSACSCGSTDFRKETDVLDVWFDSGASHAAVLAVRPELRWPADLYVEGHDQHRGWFQHSLWTALAWRGEAPYHVVLTHGFVQDEAGRKMSKSLGNYIDPQELVQRHGADVLRLWTASVNFKDDVRTGGRAFEQVSEVYRRFRNTARFMLANLYDFRPGADRVPYGEMGQADQWALHRLQELVKQATEAFQEFEFHRAVHAINAFCAVDMSAFYLDMLKDRLYVSPAGGERRRSAQTALYELVTALARLLAPVLSHTAEETWRHLPEEAGRPESVHLADWPQARREWLNEELSGRWSRFLQIRSQVTRAIEAARTGGTVEQPLEASVTVFAGPEDRSLLEGLGEDLAGLFIVSHAVVRPSEEAPQSAAASDETEGVSVVVQKAAGRKCARCWLTRTEVGDNEEHASLCARCVRVVSG